MFSTQKVSNVSKVDLICWSVTGGSKKKNKLNKQFLTDMWLFVICEIDFYTIEFDSRAEREKDCVCVCGGGKGGRNHICSHLSFIRSFIVLYSRQVVKRKKTFEFQMRKTFSSNLKFTQKHIYFSELFGFAHCSFVVNIMWHIV